MSLKTAQPSIYDLLAEYQRIILDAINVERMGMAKNLDAEIEKIREKKTNSDRERARR